MQIHQMQVSADPIQDRLLLRISTPSQQEVRVFLTRRFLRELWPHLMSMLSGHFGSRQISLEVNETASGGESAPDADQSSFPLGCSPLLAAEARLEAASEGLCRLTVRELKERSFTMTLNADLLQALCAMLRASCEQVKWDLLLDYSNPAATTLPKADKARLH